MNRRQFLKAMGIGAAGLALGGTYYVNRPEFGRLPTGMRRERILASPHYYDGQFQNLEPIDQTVKGGEAKAMAEFLFGSSEGLKPKGRMISQKTDLHSLPLVVEQALGAYGFNLRHNDVGLVSGHGSVEGVAVEHAEHIALIGHLHGRGAGIAVASHDILPCPLGCNDELTAQFA